MLAMRAASAEGGQELWRALGNPIRRRMLDELSRGPRTTGELAAGTPGLSRFAVMQHLEVLTQAGVVVVRRQGKHRFNYLNAAPLRGWYERWVAPLADKSAGEVLALRREVEKTAGKGTHSMPVMTDEFRTVRIESELRFRATPERVYDVLVNRGRDWFPATYGEERVQSIVLEPRVGGIYYEDWGEGRGHLYGVVTSFDAPHALAYRGQLHQGTILDTEYELEQDRAETVLKVSKVAVGPISEEQAAGIHKYGDVANFEEALRRAIEGG